MLPDAAVLCCRVARRGAGLGTELLREGLIKDEEGRDKKLEPPAAAAAAASAAGAAPDAASASPAMSAASVSGSQGSEDEELVEYEGMLVTGAVAQRRG